MKNKASGNDKKHTLILLIAVTAALITCAACIALGRDAALAVQGAPEQRYLAYYSSNSLSSQESEKEVFQSQAAALPFPSPVPQAAEEEYLVTLYEGKLGVFRIGDAVPIMISDAPVSLLPEEDLRLLRKGIRVTGLSAARAVLEDYE